MNRFARKVDANHSEIVDALRAAGVRVFDMSATGEGCPDLCCLVRGHTVWVEVKDGNKPPSARKLTPAQIRWHEVASSAGVKVHVVENVQQALAVFGARMAA
jgi:Holliday junction resolvase